MARVRLPLDTWLGQTQTIEEDKRSLCYCFPTLMVHLVSFFRTTGFQQVLTQGPLYRNNTHTHTKKKKKKKHTHTHTKKKKTTTKPVALLISTLNLRVATGRAHDSGKLVQGWVLSCRAKHVPV